MSIFRLGVDVGGTHTDVVVLDERDQVVCWHKTPTTPQPFDGIHAAIGAVLEQVDSTAIVRIVLGTTQTLNAILARRHLSRVGVLRLAAPATLAVEPLAGWPDDLRTAVAGPVAIVRGGHDFDGTQFEPLDEQAVADFAARCRGSADAVAVTGMSSPANAAHERRAAQLLRNGLGAQFPVTLSHDVGNLGLLERENSAVLNAALSGVARQVISGLDAAVAAHSLRARAFLTQNDGTLLAAADAVQRPVLTIACGPTNSMRGASHLADLAEAIVVDVGGTSTDVGILAGGYPRESAMPVEIGGVLTNYRMPDLISRALGGGSVVRATPFSVGPDSVGHTLREQALIFGGNSCTLSDVSVVAGRAAFGKAERAGSLVSDETVVRALEWVDRSITDMTDRIKTTGAALPLVAVGGGAHLIPETVPGISIVVRPPYAGVASAVGAAMAEVGGTFDQTVRYDFRPRADCLVEARELAVGSAVRAGADPAAVRIQSVTEMPLAYLPGDTVRLQIKAIGPVLPTVMSPPAS